MMSRNRDHGANKRYQRMIRVAYPVERGTIVLRTEADWNTDIEPVDVVAGEHYDFKVGHNREYIHFKPCLRNGDWLSWSVGANRIALLTQKTPALVYPHFTGQARGSITDLMIVDSEILGRKIHLRAYLPSGYAENYFKRYPVVFLQDGANVFLPVEAFHGHDWHIPYTLDLFDSMSSVEQTIVVGIYADNREFDYTKPGYEAYGRSFVAEVKPFIEERFRTLKGRENVMLMGSSLGAVVSFYLAWEYPSIIGSVACLSGAFSYRDDLLERVQTESIAKRRNLRFYLDSGWPQDNYEQTLDMAYALCGRGFALGRHVHHLVFPRAHHTERSWAARCHLPLQLFSGTLSRLVDLPPSATTGKK